MQYSIECIARETHICIHLSVNESEISCQKDNLNENPMLISEVISRSPILLS